MSSLINDLIIEGALVLYHDYRSKSAFDFSGNSNNGSHTDTQFVGNGIKFPISTSLITVADSASIQLTEGSLIFLLRIDVAGVTHRLISKFDAGGVNYQLSITSADVLRFYDGSVNSDLSISSYNKKYIAVNFKNGEAPEGFVDGLSAGDLDEIVSVSTDDADLVIGNNYLSSDQNPNLLLSVLIVNRKLTATEHSQLFDELEEITWPTMPYVLNQKEVEINPGESGLVAAWNMKPVNSTLVDLSSDSNNLDITSAYYNKHLLCNSLHFNGSSSMCKKTVANFRSSDSSGTVEVLFKLNAVSKTQTLFCSSDEGTDTSFIYFYVNASNYILISANDGTANTVATQIAVSANQLYHVVFVSTGTTYKIYVNGAEETLSIISGSNNGHWFSDIANRDNITIGVRNRSSLDRYLDGILYSTLIYSDIKEQKWVTDRYNKINQEVLFKTDWGVNESVAAVTSGELENSCWTVDSGTATISTDTINGHVSKVFSCSVAAELFINTNCFKQTPTEAAYGTWEFWFNKVGDATEIFVGFISDLQNFTGTDNGYRIRLASTEQIIFQERNSGSSTNHFTTAAGYFSINTWNKITITRSSDRIFTVYLNGIIVDVSGGSGTNPITDTTHIISNYFIISLDAGDKFICSNLNSDINISKKLFG